MILRVCLGTSDLARSAQFYDALTAELGAQRMGETETAVYWANPTGGVGIVITHPYDGHEATRGNGTMVTLGAKDRTQVERLHALALANGGTDEGAPGVRPNGHYVAYFRDPDGNKLNAVALDCARQLKSAKLQPTLEGDLVMLRPVRPEDWQEMFAVASDPLIWEVHPERNRWQEPIFRLFFDSALESGSALAILDRTSGGIIGSSRYFGHDSELSEIEIGWTFLARAYWGGAVNREVKRLMLDHAFTFVDTVIFWVGEINLRSRRAMEKIGGVLRDEVRMREYSWGICPHVVYEIRKPHKLDG